MLKGLSMVSKEDDLLQVATGFSLEECQKLISQLPEEIQDEIFELAGKFSYFFQIRVELEEGDQHNVQQQCKKILDKYFPYMIINEPEAYESQALQLLVKEWLIYQRLFPNTNSEHLLNALSGLCKEYLDEYEEDKQAFFYALALANGHPLPAEIAHHVRRDILERAAIFAARNGDYVNLTELLPLVPKWKDQVFQGAAIGGRVSILKDMWENAGVSAFAVRAALRVAIHHQQLAALGYLLTLLQFSHDEVADLLSLAKETGNEAIYKAIEKYQSGSSILTHYRHHCDTVQTAPLTNGEEELHQAQKVQPLAFSSSRR